MATTYLTRTFSSPTDRKIFTWSAWVKRQNFGITENNNALFSGYLNSSVRSTLRFNTDKLNLQDTEGLVEILTNRLFRDVNAWYHIVVAVDTTQATASNRVKFYVNGEQETSFAQADYPVQNSIFLMGGADIHYINARNASGSVDSIDDMCYSHIHFTDGTAYDASAFGQYDANGVWTIKTSPSVTYGNNGFFILKDGNSVTDQSGNGNNWTVAGGTLTNTEDNPSNVFATWNPLVASYSAITYSNGNLKLTYPTSWTGTHATLGASNGKYYWEIKSNTTGGNGWMGVVSENVNMSSATLYFATEGQVMIKTNGDLRINNSTTSSYGSAYSNGDIVGIAIDLDSATKTIQFYKNGTTNGSLVNLPTNMQDTFIIPFVMGIEAPEAINNEANFGNGYFGSTAVASAGTNASGNGIFEYDVPTGFTALSTKGLNE